MNLQCQELKAFMHLLVADVRAWYAHVRHNKLADRYDVVVTDIQAQPWGITEFVVIDPSGVCWHIGQNTPGFQPVGRFPYNGSYTFSGSDLSSAPPLHG